MNFLENSWFLGGLPFLVGLSYLFLSLWFWKRAWEVFFKQRRTFFHAFLREKKQLWKLFFSMGFFQQSRHGAQSLFDLKKIGTVSQGASWWMEGVFFLGYFTTWLAWVLTQQLFFDLWLVMGLVFFCFSKKHFLGKVLSFLSFSFAFFSLGILYETQFVLLWKGSFFWNQIQNWAFSNRWDEVLAWAVCGGVLRVLVVRKLFLMWVLAWVLAATGALPFGVGAAFLLGGVLSTQMGNIQKWVKKNSEYRSWYGIQIGAHIGVLLCVSLFWNDFLKFIEYLVPGFSMGVDAAGNRVYASRHLFGVVFFYECFVLLVAWGCSEVYQLFFKEESRGKLKDFKNIFEEKNQEHFVLFGDAFKKSSFLWKEFFLEGVFLKELQILSVWLDALETKMTHLEQSSFLEKIELGHTQEVLVTNFFKKAFKEDLFKNHFFWKTRFLCWMDLEKLLKKTWKELETGEKFWVQFFKLFEKDQFAFLTLLSELKEMIQNWKETQKQQYGYRNDLRNLHEEEVQKQVVFLKKETLKLIREKKIDTFQLWFFMEQRQVFEKISQKVFQMLA